ncbi:OLC1v1001004C1 [Oldenlandia corymbosa var. corymbosa]|uniref:OLC1v1001004C1 n=1 Tax=Oldenlandia corymbosa var. corymbosa TaxID=529605 RepID=A0AAV1D4M5_OLDCO|nr:OLC1v1001004C1 [Oldenlandia corymbosa var. corymbosa]
MATNSSTDPLISVPAGAAARRTDDSTSSGNISLNPAKVYNLNDGINPSLMLVYVQLNDYNYLNWSRSVRTALESKLKYGFVDGTFAMPPVGTIEYMKWKQVNSTVKSWLSVAVSPDIMEGFSYASTAKQLWTI